MEMPISRESAKELILDTYHKFSKPLFYLYDLAAKSNTSEAIKVQEIYQNYLCSIGAVDGERKLDIKIQQNLKPELDKADDKELLDMLYECKTLVEAYKLTVKNEMPINPFIVEDIAYSKPYQRLTEIIRQEMHNTLPSFDYIPSPLVNNTRPGITLLKVSLDRGVIPKLTPLPDIFDIAVTRKQHSERNKYQHQCAPPNSYIMEVFRRIGLFGSWGASITHNQKEAMDTKEKKDENYDYRGKGNVFRGMQFIYKQPKDLQTMNKDILLNKCIEETIEDDIVIDKINIGTYDYVSPYDDLIMHGRYDLYPWERWGNDLDEYDKSDVIMTDTVLSRVIYTFIRLRDNEITDTEAKNEIEKSVPCPSKPNWIPQR